jgi:hypothetical protein
MSQTAPQSIPFQYGWWSFDLGEYRPCDGTYCYYEYNSLPPIAEAQFDGSLQWLKQAKQADEEDAEKPEQPAPQLDQMSVGTLQRLQEDQSYADAFAQEQDRLTARLGALAASAQQLGLTLPKAFLRLMASPALRDRIPSCTACYFDLSKKIVPCPGSEEGYVIRFLNDQQDVLSWYLYLTLQGEHCVLVSPFELDKAANEEAEESDKGEAGKDREQVEKRRRSIIANTLVCAPSFEAFIYRFWLENVLWFNLNEAEGSLSEAQQQYLAHYKA